MFIELGRTNFPHRFLVKRNLNLTICITVEILHRIKLSKCAVYLLPEDQ